MAAIEKGRDVLTLINVFTVKPQNQRKLVALLTEATERTMKRMPGFVSAQKNRPLSPAPAINEADPFTRAGRQRD